MDAEIKVKGFPIKISEFPRTLRGKVAYHIASFCSLWCRDKEALMEALLGTADDIIEDVDNLTQQKP